MLVSGDGLNLLEYICKIGVKYKIPFLNIGYSNDISLLSSFYIPDFSSCPFCNNAFASSMAMIDIFNFLSGDYKKINSLNKRVGISNKDFKKLEIVNFKDKNCKYCAVDF